MSPKGSCVEGLVSRKSMPLERVETLGGWDLVGGSRSLGGVVFLKKRLEL
jgi:hypothetical protein